MYHLGPKMVHLPQIIFLWKIINITLIYLLASFIVQNFLKILPVDRVKMHNFWAQNSHFLNGNFFSENLLMSLVSFIHVYLHAKNQSQILLYYWNIDNQRILKSHWLTAIFDNNLRTRFFPSMQFSHNANEPFDLSF